MILRPYQETAIRDIRHLMSNGVRRILLQSPTGSGKTVLTAHMIKTAASRGMNAWFIVHRRELIKQSIEAFTTVGVPHGVIASGFSEQNNREVQICSVQTLVRRMGRFKKPTLIIVDEAHHSPAGSWDRIYKDNPEAFTIGLTATPERLDGTGLNKYFDRLIHGPSVTWLIEKGYLAPYRLFAPSTPSVKGLHTRMGDYIKSELVAVVNKPLITGSAIKEYKKLADGKMAVVFCVSIEHSKGVVDDFIRAGIKAEHVDGETPTEVRDAAIERFKKGETKVLSNVELFGEGFDLPALEVAILLRPTQSLGLYLQQVGRSLRTSEGKTSALILDHAGNCERHGFPDDEREWTLEGRGSLSKGKPMQSVRICPKCFGAQRSGVSICPYCGWVFAPMPREIEEKEGDLEEINAEKVRADRKREEGMCRSEDDFVKLGISRGYQYPRLWAKHRWGAREKKMLLRSLCL